MKKRKTVKRIGNVKVQTNRTHKTDAIETPLDFADEVWSLSMRLFQAGIARGRALATASRKRRKK